MRIGNGFDLHRLVADRPLIIGGVHIPHPLGLLGHSDADVLVHAVCDALLGAAGMEDIGAHFPDTDDAYAGIDSLILLEKTRNLLHAAGHRIINIDTIIMAQEPRMEPHREAMRTNIAAAAGIGVKQVNIKATTTEQLGCIGRREGIAAMCVALID